MATAAIDYSGTAPFTPMKPNHPNSRLQDSPFSDYFTDDGRSPEQAAAPSPEKRHLLFRLNSLQSQLMHGESDSERQTFNIVERKFNEIESQLDALHSQTRIAPEMEDSGLFMEDEEDEDADHYQSHTPNGHLASPLDVVTSKQKQAESDYLLAESQRVLDSVAKANEQLCEQLKETRRIHEELLLEAESRDGEISDLQMENEALKVDLNNDHSEILFLQLQLKAVEVEVETLDQGAQRLESYAPELKEDIQRVKRQRIAEEMAKWRRDWETVDARMTRRRDTWLAGVEDYDEDGQQEWYLETVRDSGNDGQIQSVTIRRVAEDDLPASLDDGEEEVEMEGEIERQASYSEHSTQTETSPPTSLVEPVDKEGTEDTEEAEEFDCAITTSSEEDEDHVSSDNGTRGEQRDQSTQGHSAWFELWDNLASLAGMGAERF